jgi:hypothetical protein
MSVFLSVSKICCEALVFNHVPKIVKNSILFSCVTFLFHHFLTSPGRVVESSVMFLYSIQALELVNCLSLDGQEALEGKGEQENLQNLGMKGYESLLGCNAG